MLKRNHPDLYSTVQPLFQSSHHLAVPAVLAGSQPGEVYVDDIQRPTSALLVCGDRFFLAGDVRDSGFAGQLRRFLIDELFPQAAERGLESYTLYHDEPDWAGLLAQVLAEISPATMARQY